MRKNKPQCATDPDLADAENRDPAAKPRVRYTIRTLLVISSVVAGSAALLTRYPRLGLMPALAEIVVCVALLPSVLEQMPQQQRPLVIAGMIALMLLTLAACTMFLSG